MVTAIRQEPAKNHDKNNWPNEFHKNKIFFKPHQIAYNGKKLNKLSIFINAQQRTRHLNAK